MEDLFHNSSIDHPHFSHFPSSESTSQRNDTNGQFATLENVPLITTFSTDEESKSCVSSGLQPSTSYSSSLSSSDRTPSEPSTTMVSTSSSTIPSPISWIKLCPIDPLVKVEFSCIWNNCGCLVEGEPQKLELHVRNHVEEEVGNRTDDGQLLFCRVPNCHVCFFDVNFFKAHVSMHIYQAILQRIGMIALQKRSEDYSDINGCCFPSKLHIPYKGEPMFCKRPYCSMGFQDIFAYFEHVNHHVTYAERVESKDFGDSSSNGITQQPPIYRCLWDGCSANFEKRQALRIHMRHHSGEKYCACPFCGLFFANNSRLFDHVLRRMEGDLTCAFCRKTFSDIRLLKEHCEKHRSSTQCPICDVLLKTKHDLRRHIYKRHETARGEYSCEQCERCFKTEEDLVKHMAVHRDPELVCHCGRQFRWKKQLVQHMKSHDEDTVPDPYMCHVCPNRYSTGTSLGKHFKKKHSLDIPNGFSRFQYKRCEDGLLRLQTSHLMTASLAETVLSRENCGFK